MNFKKTIKLLSISELLYGFIIFIFLQLKHIDYLTYSNGYITVTGTSSLIEHYPIVLTIFLFIISWIIIPTLTSYLTYKLITKFQWKKILKTTSIIFLSDGIIWALVTFLIALPQFIFDIQYIVTWLFSIIFLISFRFLITFPIGIVEILSIHLFHKFKKS